MSHPGTPDNRKIKQIFSYLKALNNLRNPVFKQVSAYHWTQWLRTLPEHETISCTFQFQGNQGTYLSNGTFTLQVDRPEKQPVPPPPKELKDWLREGWNDSQKKLEVRASITIENEKEDGEIEHLVIRFEDDPERIRLINEWGKSRQTWAIEREKAERASKVFDSFYQLHSLMDKESEKYELMLGNGILNQRISSGGVHHPVLLQKLTLSFSPTIPRFTITESDEPVVLYNELFMGLPGAEATTIRKRQNELEQAPIHPLEQAESTVFFKGLVNTLGSNAIYTGVGPIEGDRDSPRIGFDPVMFIRNRSVGFANGLENILQNLESDDSIPSSLTSIAGIEREPSSTRDRPANLGGHNTLSKNDILLTKPANPEQFKIAERLERYGSVIVQGPPGTGKTHTIANLIGHLLAQGKRILVTSHTSKALSRVREQLVEPLQSLCVSVLGKDAESRAELKSSIDAISSKIASENADTLEKRAHQLEKRRNELISILEETQQALLEARSAEYRDIVVNGSGIPPSDASRQVNNEEKAHGWIPGPVSPGIPSPLSVEELQELYLLNQRLTQSVENELGSGLPDIKQLANPSEIKTWLSGIQKGGNAKLQMGHAFWNPGIDASFEDIKDLAKKAQKALNVITNDERWFLELVDAGRSGGGREKPWEKLIEQIIEVNQFASTIEDQLITYDPRLSSAMAAQDQTPILQEITAYVKEKGKIGKTRLMMNRAWASLLKEVKVARGTPSTIEEFSALSNYSLLVEKRQHLLMLWDRLISQRGGWAAEKLGEKPERNLTPFSSKIEYLLNWYHRQWLPVKRELTEAGFLWKNWIDAQEQSLSDFPEIKQLKNASKKLPVVIITQAQRLYLINVKDKYQAAKSTLQQWASSSNSQILLNMFNALEQGDFNQYASWHNQLLRVQQQKADLDRRSYLLDKLQTGAPQWAFAIQQRNPPHDSAQLPGSPEPAWTWIQLVTELERRARVSISELQKKAEKTETELRKVTGELVECRAWATQVRRLQDNLDKRQALIGWQDTIKKIGAGTGKRVPKLRRQARRLMKKCKSAVPVWVMPLTGVVENFDPRDNRFDVVIIDEASQVDVMGLVALFMANSVVVVGDHEQVSPAAVGQKVNEIEYLIDEHLRGIPNAALYDGKTSVYDLARQSFGGIIGLREHFRCVPDIIQFSNALCYDFSIRPLRDASHVQLKPHVVSHRVSNANFDGNKTNHKEALELSSLLIAASEQPEYKGKSFGVVTMVGDAQAELIEKILRTHLTPVQYEQDLHILCGNPAQFQGDERDIMFISVVHASTGKPLRSVSAEMYKQRFNVAASRARDQMWVVHSLDPKTDLKQGDLRRRLIEHAMNPGQLSEELEEGIHKTESEFERQVLKRLIAQGYHVVPQWKVGAYRIDLVVVGPDGNKLAVECDGDRYHPIEKLPEDMERQAILERLGWTFARIRGSVFFRDPDAAMRPVFERLQELEIEPSKGNSQAQESPNSENKLLDRIRRRAAELREKWMAEEIQKISKGRDQHLRKVPGRLTLGRDSGFQSDRIAQKQGGF